MIGSTLKLFACSAALALVGCAGTREPAAETVSLEAPGGVGPVPSAEITPTPEKSPAPTIAASSPSAQSEGAPTAAEPTAEGQPVGEDSKPAPVRRTDGRPVWWLDEPVREHGMVLVTAEALAPDLRAARRAAVEAGLARLRETIGAEPASWEIRLSTISPLRAVRAPGGVNRFAGYVLIAGSP